MDRIIKYIKNIFKPKKHTLKDKIEFLLNRNIDVYSDRYNIEFYNFIYKDIISTLDIYKYINTFSIESQVLNIGYITENTYKSMKLFQWFTDTNRLIVNKQEILNEFFTEGSKLVRLYEFRIQLVKIKNNSYLNAKKIAPIYNEFIRIVDFLYNIEKE